MIRFKTWSKAAQRTYVVIALGWFVLAIGGMGVLITQGARDAMPAFFVATIAVAAGAMWVLGVSVAQAAGRGGGAAMAHGFKLALVGWIPQHTQSGLPEGWREMYAPGPNLPR